MGLKSNVPEIQVNHVWTTNTTEELNKLVQGYLSNGWKMLELKIAKVDLYNRMLEVCYVFIRTEVVYNQESLSAPVVTETEVENVSTGKKYKTVIGEPVTEST